MRKSLIMMVIMLTTLSFEKSSAFFSQNSGCCFTGFREKSLELNVGYRRDYLHWKFKDPSVQFFQSLIPFGVGLLSADISNLKGSFSVAPNRIITEDNAGGAILGLLGAIDENVLSLNDTYRSQWKDLRMINVGGIARAVTCGDFYGRFSGNYGYVCDGKYKPSGIYAGNREFIDDLLSTCGLAGPAKKRAKGHVWDVSGALGYQMSFCDCDFKFTPLLGYAYHDTDFDTECGCHNTASGAFLGGIFDFSDFSDAVDIGEQLVIHGKSKADYSSYWTGPYLGFDSTYQWDCNLNLFLNFEYHWAAYRANGSVKNFRTIEFGSEQGEIISGPFSVVELSSQRQVIPELLLSSISSDIEHCATYKHHACARGLFLGIGANYNICDCWWAGIKFNWMDWRTHKHGRIEFKSETQILLDTFTDTEFSDIEFDEEEDFALRSLFCKDARLKSVHWNSYRIELTVSRSF